MCTSAPARSTSSRPARASSQVQLDRAIALVDHAVEATEIDREAAERMLEEAKAELERIESGESTADRWVVEQRHHPRGDAARGRGRRLGHSAKRA